MDERRLVAVGGRVPSSLASVLTGMFGAKRRYMLPACFLGRWVGQSNEHSGPRIPRRRRHGQLQAILAFKNCPAAVFARGSTRGGSQALNEMGESVVGLFRRIENCPNQVKPTAVDERHDPVDGELAATSLQALKQDAGNQICMALDSNAGC